MAQVLLISHCPYDLQETHRTFYTRGAPSHYVTAVERKLQSLLSLLSLCSSLWV